MKPTVMMKQSWNKTLKTILAILLLGLCMGTACRLSASILYGADGAGGNLSNLYILNPTNGSIISTVGPIGFSITGLAIDPTTGVLYGSTSRNGAPTGNLVTIDQTTGTGTLVGSYGVPNHTMADLTFTSNGTLYGWAESSLDDLHTINKSTGAATDVGNAGISTFGSGLAANSADVIYFTGSGASGPLRIVNKTTGLPTTVATLSGAPFPTLAIDALAFDGSILFGVNGADGGPGGTSFDLVTINTITGVVTDLGPTVNNLDAIVFTPEPATWVAGVLVFATLAFSQRRRTVSRPRN